LFIHPSETNDIQTAVAAAAAAAELTVEKMSMKKAKSPETGGE
jgi:hypothetical protein